MLDLELIKILLVVFGMIGPIVIILYMIVFMWAKRCALCGARMSFKYRQGVVDYVCPKCRRHEINVLK